MSKFACEWVKTDDYGNKICSVKEGSEMVDYTISPKDKKGREFPGFADIKPGSVVEGNSWQSPKNSKWYIFAPDEKKNPNGTYAPKVNIKEAMAEKREGIAMAQENKAEAIKISSTINHAVDIAIAQWNYDKTQSIEDLIAYWRQFLWTHWDAKDSDFPPMP